MDVQSFETDVIEASYQTPDVVDFWAGWCGPCRFLGPVLEGLAERAAGSWQLAKVNVDENPEVAQTFRIQSIPAVKLFHEGKDIAEFVGALPEPEVKKWLEENLPSESKEAVEEAEKAMDAGESSCARSLLEGVIAQDPGIQDARVLLAGMLFESDPEKASKMVHDVGEDHPRHGRADAVRILFRLLNLEESNPEEQTETWGLYLQGAEALREHRYPDAMEAWIEVIRRGGRDVDDDGARKACVVLFNWLGDNHDISREYRRSFSSALF